MGPPVVASAGGARPREAPSEEGRVDAETRARGTAQDRPSLPGTGEGGSPRQHPDF